eukprot:TRINITY_DN74494_c0_g1_i1.p1 TRINITY_DN74494_c0_g1~~TRINITY_DN74494_c0_g1_i1.p1  ORF type:complete len:410 (-),score=36.60 TRINITY_DN74494_c0_g1_i1:42-1271(-)
MDCPGRGTSMCASVLMLAQSMIGGGLLTFPHAFLVGGIFNMFLIQSMMLPFIAFGLWVLAWCSERTGADSFQGLMKAMLGRNAEFVSAIAVVVLIFGASVVYLDIFVDQVYPWFQDVFGRTTLTILVASMMPLMVLGEAMSSMTVPSLFGSLALLYVVFVIALNFVLGWSNGNYHFNNDGDVEPVLMREGIREWLTTIPVVCFSYQGHISAVPLYAELNRRSMQKWGTVITFGLGGCVVLYNIAGCLGYVQFLDATQGDILKSFLANEKDLAIPAGMLSIARAAVATKVAVTSSMFTFCARSAILDELQFKGAKYSYSLFLWVTVAWSSLVSIVAILVPDIAKIVSVIGNVSCLFMFQFPGMCILATVREDISMLSSTSKWSRLVAGWTLILLGMFIFCSGLFNALVQL